MGGHRNNALASPLRLLQGTLKGKKLPAHDAWVRPTSVYRREMIFNCLMHDAMFPALEKCHVVDVFAGTGALGLEALSRGAGFLTLIEKNVVTFEKLQAFLSTHNLQDRVQLLHAEVPFLPQAMRQADLCFLDAPYGEKLVPQALENLYAQGWIGPDTCFVAELDQRETLPLPPWVELVRQKRKGRTQVIFLRARF